MGSGTIGSAGSWLSKCTNFKNIIFWRGLNGAPMRGREPLNSRQKLVNSHSLRFRTLQKVWNRNRTPFLLKSWSTPGRNTETTMVGHGLSFMAVRAPATISALGSCTLVRGKKRRWKGGKLGARGAKTTALGGFFVQYSDVSKYALQQPRAVGSRTYIPATLE